MIDIRGNDLEVGEMVDSSKSDDPVSAKAERPEKPYFVLPLAAVLGSASVSFLCFLGLRAGQREGNTTSSQSVSWKKLFWDPRTPH